MKIEIRNINKLSVSVITSCHRKEFIPTINGGYYENKIVNYETPKLSINIDIVVSNQLETGTFFKAQDGNRYFAIGRNNLINVFMVVDKFEFPTEIIPTGKF